MSDCTAGRLAELVEPSLKFRFLHGGVTTYRPPYQRKFRAIPYLLLAHVTGGRFRVEFQHGRSRTLSPGEVMVISEGTTQRVRMLDRRATTDHWAMVMYRVLGSVNLTELVRVPPIVRSRRLIRELDDLIRVAGDPKRPPLDRLAGCQEVGFRLLRALLNRADVVEGRIDPLERMRPVLQFMESNLARPITRPELAARLHLSPTRFHTVFKNAMSMAPLAYLQRLRVQTAQRLLVSSSLPVAEVGRSVGYGDPFHFSRLFKAECGVSPSGYRNQFL